MSGRSLDESTFHKLFREDTCVVGLEATDKNEVLAELIDATVAAGRVDRARRDTVLEAMIARESLGSTGIGSGIAIPHVKTDEVDETVTAVGISKQKIDFRAVDGEPCDVFFLLISPKDQAETHLQILRWLSKLVRNPDFSRFMRSARNAKEAVSLFKEMGG